MNPAHAGSFESIPLTAIRPSLTNPRKHFDESALAELTASIREIGVTVPIHVRSLDQDRAEEFGAYSYELVTGERRFRASQAADMHGIPAIVHDGLSDEDAMELQLVENLQRADLHPTEEADGYRALMAHGETAEDVAKKAGKTLGYVQQRLKLLTLEVDAKNLFASGHLTLGHALLLARLTAADQERALVFLLGIAQHEIRKDHPAEKIIAARMKDFDPKYSNRLVEKSELRLKDWIGSNVLLQLKTAPWDLGDPDLVPSAGPCTTCPKRTGANQALFADITTNEDTCVDGACYSDKLKAFTQREQKIAKEQGSPLLKISVKESTEKLEKPVVEMRGAGVKLQGGKAVETQKPVVVATKPVKQGQWVAAKKGSCPMTVQAIATDGPDQGKLKWVCPDQSCKVHPRHVSRPQSASKVSSAPRGESYEERSERQLGLLNKEIPVRMALFKAVAAKLKPTAEALREILMGQFDYGDDGHFEYVCAARGWAVKEEIRGGQRVTDAEKVLQRELNRMATPDELVQLMVEMHVAEEFPVETHEIENKDHRANAIKTAKKYKVDADKIIAKAEAELKAASPAAADKQASAKKKAGK